MDLVSLSTSVRVLAQAFFYSRIIRRFLIAKTASLKMATARTQSKPLRYHQDYSIISSLFSTWGENELKRSVILKELDIKKKDALTSVAIASACCRTSQEKQRLYNALKKLEIQTWRRKDKEEVLFVNTFGNKRGRALSTQEEAAMAIRALDAVEALSQNDLASSRCGYEQFRTLLSSKMTSFDAPQTCSPELIWEASTRLTVMGAVLCNHNSSRVKDFVQKMKPRCLKIVAALRALDNTTCKWKGYCDPNGEAISRLTLCEGTISVVSCLVETSVHEFLEAYYSVRLYALLAAGPDSCSFEAFDGEVCRWVKELLWMTEKDYFGHKRCAIVKASKCLQLWAGTSRTGEFTGGGKLLTSLLESAKTRHAGITAMALRVWSSLTSSQKDHPEILLSLLSLTRLLPNYPFSPEAVRDKVKADVLLPDAVLKSLGLNAEDRQKNVDLLFKMACWLMLIGAEEMETKKAKPSFTTRRKVGVYVKLAYLEGEDLNDPGREGFFLRSEWGAFEDAEHFVDWDKLRFNLPEVSKSSLWEYFGGDASTLKFSGRPSSSTKNCTSAPCSQMKNEMDVYRALNFSVKLEVGKDPNKMFLPEGKAAKVRTVATMDRSTKYDAAYVASSLWPCCQLIGAVDQTQSHESRNSLLLRAMTAGSLRHLFMPDYDSWSGSQDIRSDITLQRKLLRLVNADESKAVDLSQSVDLHEGLVVGVHSNGQIQGLLYIVDSVRHSSGVGLLDLDLRAKSREAFVLELAHNLDDCLMCTELLSSVGLEALTSKCISAMQDSLLIKVDEAKTTSAIRSGVYLGDFYDSARRVPQPYRLLISSTLTSARSTDPYPSRVFDLGELPYRAEEESSDVASTAIYTALRLTSTVLAIVDKRDELSSPTATPSEEEVQRLVYALAFPSWLGGTGLCPVGTLFGVETRDYLCELSTSICLSSTLEDESDVKWLKTAVDAAVGNYLHMLPSTMTKEDAARELSKTLGTDAISAPTRRKIAAKGGWLFMELDENAGTHLEDMLSFLMVARDKGGTTKAATARELRYLYPKEEEAFYRSYFYKCKALLTDRMTSFDTLKRGSATSINVLDQPEMDPMFAWVISLRRRICEAGGLMLSNLHSVPLCLIVSVLEEEELRPLKSSGGDLSLTNTEEPFEYDSEEDEEGNYTVKVGSNATCRVCDLQRANHPMAQWRPRAALKVPERRVRGLHLGRKSRDDKLKLRVAFNNVEAAMQGNFSGHGEDWGYWFKLKSSRVGQEASSVLTKRRRAYSVGAGEIEKHWFTLDIGEEFRVSGLNMQHDILSVMTHIIQFSRSFLQMFRFHARIKWGIQLSGACARATPVRSLAKVSGVEGQVETSFDCFTPLKPAKKSKEVSKLCLALLEGIDGIDLNFFSFLSFKTQIVLSIKIRVTRFRPENYEFYRTIDIRRAKLFKEAADQGPSSSSSRPQMSASSLRISDQLVVAASKSSPMFQDRTHRFSQTDSANIVSLVVSAWRGSKMNPDRVRAYATASYMKSAVVVLPLQKQMPFCSKKVTRDYDEVFSEVNLYFDAGRKHGAVGQENTLVRHARTSQGALGLTSSRVGDEGLTMSMRLSEEATHSLNRISGYLDNLASRKKEEPSEDDFLDFLYDIVYVLKCSAVQYPPFINSRETATREMWKHSRNTGEIASKNLCGLMDYRVRRTGVPAEELSGSDAEREDSNEEGAFD